MEGESQRESRGVFLVFEGLDKSGKSKQICNLIAGLHKAGITNIKSFNFPERQTRIGKIITSFLKFRSSLNPQTSHLLFSANRWEFAEDITSTLNSGIHVIADRYVYSGITYSMANGLSKDYCMTTETGLPKPDVNFFLDANPETLKKRSKKRKLFERPEIDSTQLKVYEHFHKIIDQNPDKWVILDATEKPEMIHSKVIEHVLNLVKKPREEMSFFEF